MIEFALIIMALLSVILPFIIGKSLGLVKWLSPLQILSYLVLFGMMTKTIFLTLFGGELYFGSFSVSEISIVYGYVFITLFVVMICLGYSFAAADNARSVSPKVVKHEILAITRINVLFLLGLTIGLAVVFQMLSTRGFSGIGSLFDTKALDALNSSKIMRIEGEEDFGASGAAIKVFLFIPTFAMLVFFGRLLVTGRGLFTSIFLIAFELFLVFSQGKRFGLLMTFAALFLILSLLRIKFNGKQIVAGAIAAASVLALFVTMTTMRANKGFSESVSFDVQPAVSQVVQSTYFMDVSSPILIIDRADPADRFWGASYGYWAFAWIPRAIWTEKPAISLGPYVKREVLGIPGSIGGVNPTGPGEAFLNFGWLGILVGFGLGVVYRKLESLTLSTRWVQAHHGIWLYSLIVFPLIIGTIQSSFSASVTAALVKAVLLLLVVRHLKRPLRVRRKYKYPRKSRATLKENAEGNPRR